ncbi:MAG: Gfo/Idh/MocA family oxidoreductase [Acidobacteria bacterium]|nr:Gfo/Idh/MocA family oxidoreductase [Acidobacteriota bacterium]MBI3470802.1 Gfo/Idh/MocA family oxidoreductase [Candidatus Solibacter usitatus]
MSDRRNFLQATGAALTTQIFTGRVKGANDRIAVAFIGMGRMGMGNLGSAMRQSEVEVVAVCDVYQPHLEKAVAASSRGAQGEPEARKPAKGIKDFRQILSDKSIDAVCVATPDHWHPYMTVEACKAGKDVYVEKPICVVVEEGRTMVQAARKYNRVVQVGTQQRSGLHFQKACDLVKNGYIGTVTFIRTWNYGNGSKEGIGNPPDGQPPTDLDWDLWLGPAPAREFNANRFGVDPKAFSHFRWFWDYAGGMMTDWGIHVLDIARMGMAEADPIAITSLGGKYVITDNRDTPDTLQVTYEFPGFLATYENRMFNGNSMFNQGYGTVFHGTKGTLFVDRSKFVVIPEKGSGIEPMEEKSSNNHGLAHWQNFIACIKSRERPASDIEIGHRSTTTALLGNVALRSRLRIDWDPKTETTAQTAARPLLRREYRKPWKLEV